MSGWSCLPRVAALITGEDFEEVLAFLGHDGSAIVADSPFADGVRGFRFREIVAYLAARGYHLGAAAQPADLPAEVSAGQEIRLAIRTDAPALLIVQGREYNHAVLWTGKQVLDTYRGLEIKTLSDYTVLQWWPVLQIV
jgi:hypothetical protein